MLHNCNYKVDVDIHNGELAVQTEKNKTLHFRLNRAFTISLHKAETLSCNTYVARFSLKSNSSENLKF